MGLKYQVVIEIDEDDQITMETLGFKGPKCVDEIKKIIKNLGQIDTIEKTKEYYEEEKSKLKSTQKNFSK